MMTYDVNHGLIFFCAAQLRDIDNVMNCCRNARSNEKTWGSCVYYCYLSCSYIMRCSYSSFEKNTQGQWLFLVPVKGGR